MRNFYLLLVILLFCYTINAQWEQCNGPYGGSIYTIKSHGDNIYLGTRHGGFYFSEDNAKSWVDLTLQLPIDGQIFQIESDDRYIYIADYYQIIRYQNNGSNKIIFADTVFYGGINKIITYENSIFTLTAQGIYLSTDKGENWEELNVDLIDTNIKDMTILRDTIFVLTENRKLYLSAINNLNWISYEDGLPDNLNHTISIGNIGNKVYLNTDTGVYLFSFYGSNWVEMDKYQGTINDIVNYKNVTFFIKNKTLYKSFYSGDSLIPLIYGNENEYFRKITINNDYLFAVTNLNNIYRSLDYGITWDTIKPNIHDLSLEYLYSYKNTIITLSSYGYFRLPELFKSTDNGLNWKNIGKYFTKSNILRISIYKDTIFTYNSNSNFYMSTDFGETWIEKLDSVELGFINFYYHNSKIYLVTRNINSNYNNLYINKNCSKDWEKVISLEDSLTIQNIDFLDEEVFIATNKGVFSSTNDFKDFHERNEGLERSGSLCYIGFIKTNLDELIIQNYETLYRSTDRGISWIKINITNGKPIYNTQVYKNIIFGQTSNNYYIFSTDYGNTWNLSPYDSLLLVREIYNLSYTINDEYIFTSFTHGPIFRAKLSDFPITDIQENQPKLTNNIFIYPNPASDYIEINYSNVDTGLRDVSIGLNNEIKVYNALGVCVKQQLGLLSKSIGNTRAPIEIGIENSIRIDVSDLPTGIYFIKVGNNVERFVKL